MSQDVSLPLPILVEKIIHDAGLDLIEKAGDEGYLASISGTPVRAWICPDAGDTWLAFPVSHGERLGLQERGARPLPPGMMTIGKVESDSALYMALHTACVLQLNTPRRLSERVEARLSAIAETERTREVRQCIGQDVFREALFELWGGRCAVTDTKLPSSLLRASHAKPWAQATDNERLDPFNGLLLSVQLDTLFDSGLLTFDSQGLGHLSATITPEVKSALEIHEPIRITGLTPSHLPYLAYHRQHVAKQ